MNHDVVETGNCRVGSVTCRYATHKTWWPGNGQNEIAEIFPRFCVPHKIGLKYLVLQRRRRTRNYYTRHKPHNRQSLPKPKPSASPLPLPRHHFFTGRHPRASSPRRSHFFRTRQMTNQSGSVSFQSLLESALMRYEIKTGVTLSRHSLALQLQRCNSVEDFNKLLQDNAKDIRESERITKSMKTIESILTPLSPVTSLTDAVGLDRKSVV